MTTWNIGRHRAGWFVVIAAWTGLAVFPLTAVPASPDKPLAYPKARKGKQVDLYHETKVPDPYRWLEDPDSSESREWIEAQNRLTFGYLEQIPKRAAIKKRLTEIWDYEKYGLYHKEGDRYFFKKNDGLQNQHVLYTVSSLQGRPKVLLDPNQLSPDGTVSLRGLDRLRPHAGVLPHQRRRRIAIGNRRTGADLSRDASLWPRHLCQRYSGGARGHRAR